MNAAKQINASKGTLRFILSTVSLKIPYASFYFRPTFRFVDYTTSPVVFSGYRKSSTYQLSLSHTNRRVAPVCISSSLTSTTATESDNSSMLLTTNTGESGPS